MGVNGAGKGAGEGGSFRHFGGRGVAFGLGASVTVTVAMVELSTLVSSSAMLPVLSALVVGLVVMVAPVAVGPSSYK